MRSCIAFALVLVFKIGFAQSPVERYFEKIRNNSAELTAFMAQMPKGGDLHHHYTGSVYAETFLDYVIANDYAVNLQTLEINPEKPTDKEWTTFSALKTSGALARYSQLLLMQWSVKDYEPSSGPSDKHFFDSFDKFKYASAYTVEAGLLELKNRAIRENVSYLETMFLSVPCPQTVTDLLPFNDALHLCQQTHNDSLTNQLLDSLYTALVAHDLRGCALDYNENVIKRLHQGLAIDDSAFTMRYQNFVLRFLDPVPFFKSLILCCESDQNSDLVVGVNVVAPEDGEVSMADYWLHMRMFRYIHSRYPDVKFAMHAGELALGMVQPEELTWHIQEAVYVAGARRIGHGVAVPYEQHSYDLLRHMAREQIPVEINLTSNEFILHVQGDRHPTMLYRSFGVPIVISSDDAGILRTSLTEQYVLLAHRYPDITYAEIRQYVYNSIAFSFLSAADKQRLKADLDARFAAFEAEFGK